MNGMESMFTGDYAELKAKARLWELRYRLVFEPAFRDIGCDLVVYTSLGWRGVQVKTAVKDYGHREDGSPRLRYRLDLPHYRRAGYYEARGVHAYLVFRGDGFYVVPVSAGGGQKRVRLGQGYWEAWGAVLGDPVVDLPKAEAL